MKHIKKACRKRVFGVLKNTVKTARDRFSFLEFLVFRDILQFVDRQIQFC